MRSGPSAFGSRRSRAQELRGPCWRSKSRRIKLIPADSTVKLASSGTLTSAASPSPQMTSLAVFQFQVLHLQYGMYVWPCAVVLAQYLWFHRKSLPGTAVLEIGAGVSLPGILAAKCGAEVTLSDNSELPRSLEICRHSCQINSLSEVHIVGVTWGHISPDLLALPPQDIILASDVFFEPEDFEDILITVYFLMEKNPKVQLWSTYQVRSADWSLEALLYKWDMKCAQVPLESFEADKEGLAESALPGRHTIEMLIISSAKGSP